jgi:hypothetical protein
MLPESGIQMGLGANRRSGLLSCLPTPAIHSLFFQNELIVNQSNMKILADTKQAANIPPSESNSTIDRGTITDLSSMVNRLNEYFANMSSFIVNNIQPLMNKMNTIRW